LKHCPVAGQNIFSSVSIKEEKLVPHWLIILDMAKHTHSKKSPHTSNINWSKLSYGKAVSKKDVKVLSTKQVYAGPAFTVHTDQVREGRKKGCRDIIRHTGSVVILAVDEGHKKHKGKSTDSLHATQVLLIQQYRHAPGEVLWELPAGRVDPGENKLAAAKRELLEETGVHGKRWQKALTFWASPGFLAESLTVFLARGLSLYDAQPEEDEQIHVRFVSLADAVEMVMSNRIRDAKTMCSVLWLARKLDARIRKRVVRKRK